MKIHFDNVSFSSRSGPNTFASRLAKQLIEEGNEVIEDGTNADVSLVFIERSGKPLAKKLVQRLDGIWFKPGESFKNAGISATYQAADAVIFQSQFDSKMCSKWLGSCKRPKIIHNGIEINPIKDVTKVSPELLKIRATYDTMYVCSANWHPQKRLRANLEMFDHLRKQGPGTSCMIVMGSNPDVYVADPHVYYTGSMPHDLCLQVFALADWMIHLAWADHCPNTVIESLSQHTPVVCAQTGGTKELIEGFGVVLDEPTYDFGLFDYDDPPFVDVTQIASLPHRSELTLGFEGKIDIRNVASAYIQTFKELI